MLWFSVGRKDDFDNTDAYDIVDAKATRFAPNIGLKVTGTGSAVKQFDKGYYDLYASFDMYQSNSGSNFHSGRLLAFVDSTGTIVASLKTVYNNNFNYGAILEINGNVLDVSYGFAIQVMSINQIEMHITCNGANSAVQVYLNGDLVVNYSGSITSNKLTALRFEANDLDEYTASNFIITDEGRIGKKYPILLPLKSIGAKNDASYYTFVGNVDNNSAATGETNASYLIDKANTFIYSGVISKIKIKFTTSGTYSVGVVTTDSNGNSKLKYVANNLTAAVGMNTLIAGNDIPDSWSVTPSDRIVLYDGTAAVAKTYNGIDNKYIFTNFTVVSKKNLLDGNAFSEPSSISIDRPIISVQYSADSCENDGYKISDGVLSICSVSGVNAIKYLDLNANGATVYMNFAKVPAVVNSILALKLSIKAIASINLQNGEWLMNIAGKEISTPLPLPTTINQKDVLLEGTWLKSDIDSAQVGFRART